jgi:hypothetical protein
MAKTKTKNLVKAKGNKLAPTPAEQVNKEAISTAVVVSSIEKKAAPAMRKLKKIDKIKTQADFDAAAENLKILKDIDKEASAEEDDLAKEAYEIIEKANATINKIGKHFEPFHEKIKALEVDTKSKMEKFLQAARGKVKQVEAKFEKGGMSIAKFTSKVAAVSFQKGGAAKVREVKRLEIVDESKIPREFMLPNRAAIEAELRAGKKVAGCELKTTDQIAI